MVRQDSGRADSYQHCGQRYLRGNLRLVVRILTGPLKGIEGRVIRRGKRDQFVAVVHFLGSGATVDLEDWQVEQLPDDDPDAPKGA